MDRFEKLKKFNESLTYPWTIEKHSIFNFLGDRENGYLSHSKYTVEEIINMPDSGEEEFNYIRGIMLHFDCNIVRTSENLWEYKINKHYPPLLLQCKI